MLYAALFAKEREKQKQRIKNGGVCVCRFALTYYTRESTCIVWYYSPVNGWNNFLLKFEWIMDEIQSIFLDDDDVVELVIS